MYLILKNSIRLDICVSRNSRLETCLSRGKHDLRDTFLEETMTRDTKNTCVSNFAEFRRKKTKNIFIHSYAETSIKLLNGNKKTITKWGVLMQAEKQRHLEEKTNTKSQKKNNYKIK